MASSIPAVSPEGSELQCGYEYLLVLNPGEDTTTVEVRSARTGAARRSRMTSWPRERAMMGR